MRRASWMLAAAVCLGVLGLMGCGQPQVGGERGDRPRDTLDGGERDAAPSPNREDAGRETTTCAELSCHVLASCSDSEGDARCSCGPGLTGDGVDSCEDVDECADDTLNACDDNATCVNRLGTDPSCLCKQDFLGDGLSCTDVDECSGSRNTCHPDAACSNQSNGFSCACTAGFTGDGAGCADVDECASGPLFSCHADASCQNRRGGYDCLCGPLHGGDGQSCTPLCDLAQADAGRCDAGGQGRCVIDRDGAANCSSCLAGFMGDGTTCTADGECAGLGCGANTVCQGGAGSRACACAPGHEGDPMTGCTDIDECSVPSHDCSAGSSCLNTPGGFLCQCDPGFTREGSSCVNLDECAGASTACDPSADCLDASPGFSCSCREGFVGNGKLGAELVCQDVDECAEGTDGCLDDGTARCVNTLSSFECRCKAGYAGDGVTACSDVDECADPKLNACDESAECENLTPREDPLGYRCECKDGVMGNGMQCSDLDQCDNSTLNDCDENAECIEKDNGYDCRCGESFLGNGRSCRCDLSGYWAMRQDVTLSWDDRKLGSTVFVAGAEHKATVWELHRYEYDGEKIVVRKRGCGGDASPDLHSPFYGETYSSEVPFSTFDALDFAQGVTIPLDADDAVPGGTFMTPREAAVVGLTMDDPLNDPWPGAGAVAPSDWDDTDADGQPGVSFWPRSTTDVVKAGNATYEYSVVSFEPQTTIVGGRAGCVSVGSRVITQLNSELISCGRLEGTVINEASEVRVHSCTVVPKSGWDHQSIDCTAADWQSMTACDASQVALLDNQDQQQDSSATFELVRVGSLDDKAPDCADVRDMLPAISR